jgi:hypothetical protein
MARARLGPFAVIVMETGGSADGADAGGTALGGEA